MSRTLPTVDIVKRNPLAIVDEENSDQSFIGRVRRNKKPLASLLFSMLAHAVLLTALAFVLFSIPRNKAPVSVIAEIDSTPRPEIFESPADEPNVEIVIEDTNDALIEEDSTDHSVDIEMPVPIISTDTSDSSAEDQSPVTNPDPVTADVAQPKGGGLEGREKNARASLAAKRGGTAESELAVELGLKWIVQHQRPDGSWRLNLKECPCKGRCRNSGSKESTTAATGLALMALLGAGNTHEAGSYQHEVQMGLDYLKSRIRKTYFGGNLSEGSMYAHAIATIALSEAYAMTGDEELAEHVGSVKDYIVTAQHSKGGWRYTPGEPGDMTVTGWQLMALKSCELAEFRVPDDVWLKARLFMNSVSESGSYFGYKNGDRQPTTTAVGLLMNMYMGAGRESASLFRGIQYITRKGFSRRDIYFNYYTTQVLHHFGGEKWTEWNKPMRDYLIKTQSKKGHETGSWHFHDEHGSVGGRLYTTAMAVMILEVYYRYLPLYDRPAVQDR